ncbi:hypothetical protein BKA62DRAFT_87247 [Auriculariales sp. MPI-PUGE-AT-0066]|nr:hypothetical protein BKA62DRAFT_87247 [Auriculariales sp. MPI-PUGE-AT-0066]
MTKAINLTLIDRRSLAGDSTPWSCPSETPLRHDASRPTAAGPSRSSSVLSADIVASRQSLFDSYLMSMGVRLHLRPRKLATVFVEDAALKVLFYIIFYKTSPLVICLIDCAQSDGKQESVERNQGNRAHLRLWRRLDIWHVLIGRLERVDRSLDVESARSENFAQKLLSILLAISNAAPTTRRRAVQVFQQSARCALVVQYFIILIDENRQLIVERAEHCAGAGEDECQERVEGKTRTDRQRPATLFSVRAQLVHVPRALHTKDNGE